MPFIGNPIDNRNTFQSLVGKRFNGDGSTTAFTLDVAPSSTLDLEVFVGNVRQDPNSAYSVSGTTLTFTGAPPSGTNNIYVVHQAKSVGTINPGANSVGVTELNLSDGSSGQFIKTDGSGTLSFASVASLAGIDDQSSSNDDQLTITDTAVVINEDSDDVDFRVESNGNANMLFVSGGNDVVGIGAEGDLGVGLHIKSADSGSSVASGADELVIEGSGDAGLSILSGTDANGSIMFGDSADNDGGRIQYNPNNDRMMFTTSGSEQMRIASDGGIFLNTTSRTGSSNVLSVLGNLPGDDVMHVRTPASSGSVNGISFSDGDSSDCGEIVINTGGNTTSYSTSSDYRLKENISYDFDATSRLKQLKPSRFNWISKPDTTVDGFLAHEVSSIVPEAINGTKDATKTVTNAVISKRNALITDGVTEAEWEQGKKDGIYPSDSTWSASKAIPKYQSIDQAKLVPLLTKALQEAVTKIEALEARVTTLEE
jgi:hypothetical protein